MVNLFWETRTLTQSREDHLTCFVAAALEVDDVFRAAYARLVLGGLADGGSTPEITSVHTQVQFQAQRGVPDMMLQLRDDRRVLVEHKIDAPETQQVAADGRTVKQLERYLALPGIAGLAYFRSMPVTMAPDVLEHDLYLRPPSGGHSHFLWRDLYPLLELGSHAVTEWLHAGFDRLGFTPPVPHIGELWPGDTEEVRENQKNFGKLWLKTRARLEREWQVRQDQRGCELYLRSEGTGPVPRVYVSPIAQGGSLLRLRIDTDRDALPRVRRRVEDAVARLAVTPDVSVVEKDGRVFIDLLAPLRRIFDGAETVEEQEERLYVQVVPVVEALRKGR